MSGMLSSDMIFCISRAIHIVNGEGSEQVSSGILDTFIESANLKTVFPAARNFGFNNPDGIPDNDPTYGYERWVSIPDDMEVPAPTSNHTTSCLTP